MPKPKKVVIDEEEVVEEEIIEPKVEDIEEHRFLKERRALKKNQG